MFRSKKEVDRHVKDIFEKLKTEKERTLRCYNIAKLYYQVRDYESAKRYVSSYLEVKEESAGAHKLLGQIYEALGNKEAAFNQYKTSLELDGKQNDLVLKVCELLVDMDSGTDVNQLKYWAERASKQFPHDPIVFQLKEKMLMVERPNDNNEDLEALIASELSVKPTNVDLRVKLIKYYMTKKRFNDAYDHAANVEATYCHRNSIVWYETLSELLTKCVSSKENEWSFWTFYISTLERYVALSLKEHGEDAKKTVSEATEAVLNFDQVLTKMKSKGFLNYCEYTEAMLNHMWGQLNFHLACLLLRKTKRQQGNWDETSRLCVVLFLCALHVDPIDPFNGKTAKALWVKCMKDQFSNLLSVWHKEGSYRCSQAGHILQDCAKNNTKKLMNEIDTFCTGTDSRSWRQNIYQKIFGGIHRRDSYFCTYVAPNPPLHLRSSNELKRYDKVAEEVWPDSLHHHVWLGIRSQTQSNKENGPYPRQYSHIFSELQFSVYNLAQAAPDTLCQLDVDAFLNAAVLCSFVLMEEQQQRGFMTPKRLPTFPADLTNSLCSSAQEKWWSCAYKMYSKQEALDEDIGEVRQELRRGLEVIRCIGNHGLHPVILVHLARIFHYRAKTLKDKDPQHIPALEARSELYWSTVVPLLERLQNNQNVRITNSKLFNYEGKNMSNVELTNALEEGRLLLAQRFVREKQYEQAIDALQVLKCPEASFQQGQIYKMLADEIVSSMPRESLTSEMRSQHITMLSKARNCFYLTLDRLRSPGTNPKHPLNLELCTHISDIENELKRIEPDLSQGDLSRNECDGLSDESYSPTHSTVDQPISTVPMSALTGLGTPINMLSTPQRNTHRTPKRSSTPCRLQHQDIMDLTRNRTEARPSPERLDAQIRQMMHARDSVMQTIIEQNKVMLEANKTLMEKIDELTKEMAELRKDTQRQRAQSTNYNTNLEDDLYVLGDEDYNDMSYTANQPAPGSSISGNMFQPSHRYPYGSLMYPQATAFQGYYQGSIPFTDPNAQAIPPLYPPNMYPMPVLYPNRSKVPDGMLQQSVLPQRLPTQLTDLMPPSASTPLQMSMPKVEATKPQTVVKDTATKKAPPVNVVITTSDTLPTTVPLVQPTLSVTIPPQYRMGSTSTNTDIQNAPHNYQISMPSQATIPTTVNLPSLSATLTTTTPATTLSLSTTPRVNNVEARSASRNSSADLQEVEHDPIPDFVPLIPLPAEVKVTTGEEDEETLYCARAKLFRFVDKEWKERGVGNVKLLKNAEGKVRLLMRRDQVLKVCANHMLRPDMELTALPNNDKAWMWVANDFADERVQLEKLCIKFKTAEEALSFKKHFDNAKASLMSITQNKTSENVKIPEVIKGCSSSVVTTVTTTVVSPAEKENTTVIGGFSFTSKPIIQNIAATVEKVTPKQEKSQKVSPFMGFSFNKSDFVKPSENSAVDVMSTQPISFSVSKVMTTTSETTPTTTIVPGSATSRVSLRRPHTPSSGVTSITAAAVVSADELVLFEQKANLQKYNKDIKQWENKGIGQMKLISNKKTAKTTILMYTETSFCNPEVTEDIKLSFKPGSNTVSWVVHSHDKEESKAESFIATFKSSEQASEFYNLITKNQQKLKDSVSVDIKKQENKQTSEVVDTTKPLSELFKPAAGSWACSQCYLRNNSTQMKCVACGAPSSVTTGTAIAVTRADTSKQPPLSEMFKKPADSWECQSCCIINLETNNYCVACDTPKDPSLPPKPKSSGFTLGITPSESKPTFTFGIPQDANKTGSTGFTFRINKSVETNTTDESKPATSPTVSDTNAKSISGGTQIQKLATPTNKNAQFTFGSPEKSFGFNFTAKPSAKSPGGGETSDDEVVESDDIHFSPVIPLPDKIEVKTGEEEEEVLYSHRAKLFRFDTTMKEWKERGLGDIKLLRHMETHKLRLIMRRDQVLKLCLNHLVSPDLEFKLKDEKTWLWNAADYSEGEIEYMQFACRFKTAEIASDFKNAIDDARKSTTEAGQLIKSVDSIAIQHNQTKQQNVKTSSQDIQVVYELKVTPEEKAAALKLQLPENFYAYKQKEDCPGCLGCKEASPPLFKDMQIHQQESISTIKANGTAIPTVPTATSISFAAALQNAKRESSEKTVVTPTSGISFLSKTSNEEKELTKSTFTVSSFSNASLSFGDNKSSVFDPKKTDFVFGAPSTQSTFSEKLTASGSIGQSTKFIEDQSNVVLQWFDNNLKICEPSSMSQQSAITLPGSTNFPISTSNIFDKSQFSLGTTSSIFGLSTSNSGNAIDVSSGVAKTVSTIGSTMTFGLVAPSSTVASDSSASTTTTSIFAMKSSNLIFGNASGTFQTNLSFGGTPSIFGGTSTMTNAVASDTKSANSTSQNEDVNVSFLPSTNLTFSTLAAKGSQQEAFRKDPNFSFAGAGSCVFGSKPVSTPNSDSKSTHSQQKQIEEKQEKEENEEEECNENDNDQEHDPQFEPIIPLPDTVEVRTGEEDEEKMFCERAKLYRYDNVSKEWKERGVGEMKILYHATRETYRLLLRREQVYKVVCNFLIKPDVKFKPLLTSDRAWVWGGMNYVEKEGAMEELAVRFKTPELAVRFKEVVDKVQQTLREKHSNRGITYHTQEDQEHESVDDAEDDVDDHEDADEDEESLILEKRATLLARLSEDAKWFPIGLGTLGIYYDSEIFGEKIILKADESGEIMSNTIISMDTEMQLDGKNCIWTAIDHALEPPMRRTLKAIFSSSQAAEQIYKIYLDGLDCAKQVGITEQVYEK